MSFGADNGGRFDASTTYVSDYPAHQPAAREYAAPPPARPQVPFDGTTSYHDEFQPKKGEARPAPPPPGPPRPHMPFDGTTSYNTAYHAHQLPERPQHMQPQARPQVPFDATTTHKDTFVPHAIEPRCVHPCLHQCTPCTRQLSRHLTAACDAALQQRVLRFQCWVRLQGGTWPCVPASSWWEL